MKPLPMAALMAVVTTSEPMSCASGVPPWARRKAMASSPGLRREPETMAAMVSRMWCFVFSATSGGRGRRSASAM